MSITIGRLVFALDGPLLKVTAALGAVNKDTQPGALLTYAEVKQAIATLEVFAAQMALRPPGSDGLEDVL